MLRRLLCLAIAPIIFLSGCASMTSPEDKSSASYQSGYTAGCTSGTERNERFGRDVNRDETRYENNDLYRRGWNEGYRTCGGPETGKDPLAEPTDLFYSDGPLN